LFLITTAHNCQTNCQQPQQERQGHIDTELATVISSISLACKQIAAAVGRSGISSLTGVAGTGENVQVRVVGCLSAGPDMLWCAVLCRARVWFAHRWSVHLVNVHALLSATKSLICHWE
jgi:hypothetical protein